MNLTPEEIKDFKRKVEQLTEFAKSIGLNLTDNNVQRSKAYIRETSPEEIRISGVRNLEDNSFENNTYECKISYNKN